MGNNVQTPRGSEGGTNGEGTRSASGQGSSQPPRSKKAKNEKTNEKIKGSKKGPNKLVHDAMISYSHKDSNIMTKVLEYLESNGHTVWTDRKLQSGQEFLTTIGEAVLEAKVFLPLLSRNYTLSHVCRDEQALAYLSGKPMTPLALEPREELEGHMDLGMRLQMARYQWHVISDDHFRSTMEEFLVTFRRCLQEVTSVGGSDVTDEAGGDAEFWEHKFSNASSVEWDVFWKAFQKEYDQRILTHYGQGKMTRLSYILVRELDVITNKDAVLKGVYREFCELDGKTVSLWTRLHHQVADELAGSEVLEMDSSVRVAYIEHLGKVKSNRAVGILLDLMDSGDADMKATAALSLAKTGDNSSEVIKKLLQCLDSDDRLVRESGCLALGHVRATEAVPKLIQLWRNDVIADVRGACEVSLRLVGGDAADKAIYVTNMLSREIRDLTENPATT